MLSIIRNVAVQKARYFSCRCNVYVTCFCYTESCKDGQANRKCRYRTAVHCRAANTSSLCNSISKLNMDCNTFKEACTSSKLIMKLLSH